MKQKNKIANFWIRLLVRLIDFILVFVLSTLLLPSIVVQKNNVWVLRSASIFYLWIIYTIFLFIIFWIIMPIIWKGKTIGSFIFRTKIIVLKGSFLQAISKREIVGAWGFVFILLCFGTILNHTLIMKIIDPKEVESFNYFQSFRLSLATSLSSFVILSQMIVAISPLVRKDKKALNDVYSDTEFVHINKFVEIEIIRKKQHIIPKFVKDEPIDWIK